MKVWRIGLMVAVMTLPALAGRPGPPQENSCDAMRLVEDYFASDAGIAAVARFYDVSDLEAQADVLKSEIDGFWNEYLPLRESLGPLEAELEGPEGGSFPSRPPQALDDVGSKLKKVRGIIPKIRYIDDILLPFVRGRETRKASKAASKEQTLLDKRRTLAARQVQLEEQMAPYLREIEPLQARLDEIRGKEKTYESLQEQIRRDAAPLFGMYEARDNATTAIHLCEAGDQEMRRRGQKAAVLSHLARVTVSIFSQTAPEEPAGGLLEKVFACQCYSIHRDLALLRQRGQGRRTPERDGLIDAAHEFGLSTECQPPQQWDDDDYERNCLDDRW